MKRHFSLGASHRFSLVTLVLAAVSGALWVFSVRNRSRFILPHCIDPLTCTPDTIAGIDRWVVSYPHSPFLDSFSFITQYTAAALLLGTGLWGLSQHTLPWSIRFKRWGLDTLQAFEATLINGAAMEIVRNLVQRPRPFVYLNPGVLGQNPAHYISFYSGHTSFTVTACLTAVLILRSHQTDQPKLIRLVGIVAVSLSLLTGLFRVLSGRHFPTDVLAAAVAGIGVALLTESLHRISWKR